MKNIFVMIFLLASFTIEAQSVKPDRISIGYFGETITHPGLKIGISTALRSWQNEKINKKGKEKSLHSKIELSPATGFFYHKGYQTALFFLPDLSYSRLNQKGKSISLGIGIGYMRTFIPNTYEINDEGKVNKISMGNNFFVSSYFISYGKEIGRSLGWFIKPCFIYAISKADTGTGYFALESGINYKLNCKK